MQNAVCQEQGIRRIAVRPQPEKGGTPFQNMLFGVNAEITRRAYYGGLSAEMLNNRKLFTGDTAPAGWECTGCTFVTGARHRSLCNSNFAVLHGGSMAQTSEVIALRSGKTYTAAAWVKAPMDTVSVTFGAAGMEKTFTVEPDDAPYRALSFSFAGADVDNGTFTLKTDGELEVFEVSLLPDDHFYGMRRDVIDCLKRIGPTSIRYPGGCAADHFPWEDSLKSREFRTPMDGRTKSWFLFRNSCDQDPTDIALNEFAMLCRELGAEPEFTVSVLLSDGEDARRLVEYCNGSADTEYGAKRQALGFEPFNIKLWYIGNEVVGFGEQYRESGALAGQRTSELINAMRTADPTIATVISTGGGRKWMDDLYDNLDCVHEYMSYHEYTDFLLLGDTQVPPTEETPGKLEELFINGRAANLDFFSTYRSPEYFAGIKLCADEWNYAWGNDSSNAMLFSNALQFHLFAKTYEKYHIARAQFFLPVNEGMITVHGADVKMESSGELFRLLKPHTDGTVIECACETKDLDILCTEHEEGRCFMSVVNRRSAPCLVIPEGYRVVSAVTLRTAEYSFTNNDFALEELCEPVVDGHSVLFLSLEKE
ncbi:MAG: hypothetical protein IJ412_00610 [Oscillospiraceae bacterium]|nr:hypothetical protein [Oscillospiraceae bacterium]